MCRQVGLTDITPWAVDVSFADVEQTGFMGVLGGLFGGKKDKEGAEAESDGTETGAGDVFKRVQLYGANTPLPLKKTLSITRSADFEVGFCMSLVPLVEVSIALKWKGHVRWNTDMKQACADGISRHIKSTRKVGRLGM